MHLSVRGLNGQDLEMVSARLFSVTVSTCDGGRVNPLKHQLPSVLQQFSCQQNRTRGAVPGNPVLGR